MDDVAREAEYTKRTVYRYFTCKEDLFLAVVLKGYRRLHAMAIDKSREGCSGFEKVRLAYYAYYDFFCQYPQLLQLMNRSGAIRSASSSVDLPYQQKLQDFDRLMFADLIGLFLEGRSDCSIRSDLYIHQLALSSIFTATGFFQMLSLAGSTYTSHFALDLPAFVKLTIEVLLDSLRSERLAGSTKESGED